MTASTDSPATEVEIARLAHAIWESEGRPEGRDREHWRRAREIIEGGEAGGRLAVGAVAGDEASAPEHVPAGAAPDTKRTGEVPDEPVTTGSGSDMPGPRNPAPIPPTGPEGHVSIPSVDDAAAGSVSDDPEPPPARRGAGPKAHR